LIQLGVASQELPISDRLFVDLRVLSAKVVTLLAVRGMLFLELYLPPIHPSNCTPSRVLPLAVKTQLVSH